MFINQQKPVPKLQNINAKINKTKTEINRKSNIAIKVGKMKSSKFSKTKHPTSTNHHLINFPTLHCVSGKSIWTQENKLATPKQRNPPSVKTPHFQNHPTQTPYLQVASKEEINLLLPTRRNKKEHKNPKKSIKISSNTNLSPLTIVNHFNSLVQ